MSTSAIITKSTVSRSRRAESPNWLRIRPEKVVCSRLIPVSSQAAQYDTSHNIPSPHPHPMGKTREGALFIPHQLPVGANI